MWVAAPESAQAQLIWRLPEDGTWVQYIGTYTQKDVKADVLQGAQPTRWDKELIIRSVGTETAEFESYDGTRASVPCRWIEIKVRTGILRDGDIATGTVGQQLYKVLVPEQKIAEIHVAEGGSVVDNRDVPAAVLPIVRGFRQVGEQPVQPITARGLQVYPFLTLLAPYRTLEAVSTDPVPADVAVPNIQAMHYKGSLVMENLVSRSTNEGELWKSDETPFGLARWSVKVRREAKDKAAPRSAFVEVSTFEEEMKLQQINQNAQSELVTP